MAAIKINMMKTASIIFYFLFCLNQSLSYGQDQKIGDKTLKDYSGQEPTLDTANVYRSETNKYRIKIPKGWKINRPNNIGVEFNAMHPMNTASMNVAIAEYDKPISISAYDIPVDKFIEQIKIKYPTASLLKSEKIHLSNEECLLIKYDFYLKTLDVNVITYQYNVMRGKKAFTITFQAQESFEKQMTSIFEETLISFVFEDTIYSDQNKKENKSEDSSTKLGLTEIIIILLVSSPIIFLVYRKIKKTVSNKV